MFVYQSDSCRGGEIPPCVFEAPRGYSILGGNQRVNIREEEDDLLQYAIQQSLIEAGSEYDQVWHAITHLYVSRCSQVLTNYRNISYYTISLPSMNIICRFHVSHLVRTWCKTFLHTYLIPRLPSQVTIWEALTNSKPGTHSLSCDPSRHERSAVSIPLSLSPVVTFHPQ